MTEKKAPDTPRESLSPGACGRLLADNNIAVKPNSDSCGVETIELAGADLEGAVKLLASSDKFGLDFLVSVSAVEMPDSFDSVYHLWSYSGLNELVIKVRVMKAEVAPEHLPVVPSLASFWPAANWHERESYDLVGIRYVGHPYLRRILNPWDWQGYPLRRDYKQPVDALNDKSPGSFR